MNRLSGRVQWGLALLCAGLGATCVSRADALSAVQVLREGGCGGVVPAARPLLRSALLGTVEAPEARYTLECYSVIIVLASSLLAGKMPA